MSTPTRIKVINSYSGLARWLAELSDAPRGYLARVQVETIPSPYRYSPSVQIQDWAGRDVIWFETRHKRYEVFAVAPQMLRFGTDDEATDYHVRFRPGRARQSA